jgi:hypothetical protein
MSSINNLNKQKYIVEPFTIDNNKSKILDAGFSISVDNNLNPSFNIHVSSVALAYYKADYDLKRLRKETRSQKLKEYIDYDIMADYSLREGEREVLSLKIQKRDDKNNFYYIMPELITIANNFDYNDNVINEDFIYYANQIFYQFQYQNNQSLVRDLRGLYSSVLSEYLYYKGIEYIVKNRIYTGPGYKQGSFSTPLKKNDALINQFIFAQYLLEVLNKYYNEQLLLFKKQSFEISLSNNRSKIFEPKNLNMKSWEV